MSNTDGLTQMQARKRTDIKQMATLAMLCCIAYAVLYVSKLIPLNVAGFLSFDLKDVIIAITGFIYGPLSAAVVAVVVSLIEMVTISSTGPIGFVMNALASCAFACMAAFAYRRMHNQNGAIAGLGLGVLCMTSVMVLWNYLITPLYMNVPRDVVVSMLLPVFVPFNLIKAGINAALTILIYKPVVTSLRRARLLPESTSNKPSKVGKTGVTIVTGVVLITCVLLALVLAGVI